MSENETKEVNTAPKGGDELIVEGYRFNSLADAAAAREEKKKQAYIEQNLNFDDPSEVLAIYDKMIANNVFVTPLGFYFLKKIQLFLLASPDIDKSSVSPLPLGSVYTQRAKNDEIQTHKNDIMQKRVSAAEKQLSQKFHISLCVNIILVILILALFFVALDSSNPNILNYETAIQNKYSSWEENLDKREKAVKEREKELGMTGSDTVNTNSGRISDK